MNKLALALLVAAVTASPDGEAQQTQAPPNCSESENSGSRDCFLYQLAQADAEMDRAYLVAIDEAKQNDRLQAEQLRGYETALRESQRAWIAFRDAQCGFEAFGARGGSEAGSLSMICATEMAVERTRFLKGERRK